GLARRQHFVESVGRRAAAGRDHGHRHRSRDRAREADLEAGARAVAVHAREENLAGAAPDALARPRDRVAAGGGSAAGPRDFLTDRRGAHLWARNRSILELNAPSTLRFAAPLRHPRIVAAPARARVDREDDALAPEALGGGAEERRIAHGGRVHGDL